MKAVYDNMFYDIKECNCTEEEAVDQFSEDLRSDLQTVERAIVELNPRAALAHIEQMLKDY